MPGDEKFLGIDIGGSSVKVGVVSRDGRVLTSRTGTLPFDRGRDTALKALFQQIDRCLEDAGIPLSEIIAIGVAAPGTMDLEAGIILQPFNVEGWENLPLRQLVEERFSRRVCLQNDANAAAYGEAWVGSGRGARSLLLWTLGTGIGSGIILNGEILTGAHGHAGECGHQIIQMQDGPRSEHGLDGSLELYAGARGLITRAREKARRHPDSLLFARVDDDELQPLDIAQAAEQGDAVALELICETARFLAVGTVNVMHTIDPEIVLIGGAMTFGGSDTELGRIFLETVRATVRKMTFKPLAEKTRIEYASLGNAAGFIGAAGCAMRGCRSEG